MLVALLIRHTEPEKSVPSDEEIFTARAALASEMMNCLLLSFFPCPAIRRPARGPSWCYGCSGTRRLKSWPEVGPDVKEFVCTLLFVIEDFQQSFDTCVLHNVVWLLWAQASGKDEVSSGYRKGLSPLSWQEPSVWVSWPASGSWLSTRHSEAVLERPSTKSSHLRSDVVSCD